MRKILMAVCFIAIVSYFQAWADGKDVVVYTIEDLVDSVADCDTIVVYDGYNVHIVKENGTITHYGLNLFTDDVKNTIGKDILNRLETDLFKLSVVKNVENVSVKLISGDLNNLKNISSETAHSITTANSRNLYVEWDSANGNIKVSMPLNYQTIKGGSRADIENSFVSDIKNCELRRSETYFNLEAAEPYGDDKYIIPGYSYQNKNITRNIYLTSNSVINPIWDSNYPLESIANLFICPNDIYGDIELNVTVLKHEYGEQDKFTINLDRFLAYCEDEGCIPFWGVETFHDDKIEGALFLYNQEQGYDHVLKIDCIPHEVIEGNGPITARASLFVPTNNVHNLFQPYIKKTDKEKIRYDQQ
jgi:hypothetical protein